MGKHVHLPVVPVCTLSTQGEGNNERTLPRQVSRTGLRQSRIPVRGALSSPGGATPTIYGGDDPRIW
jgi:hypothetical protein